GAGAGGGASRRRLGSAHAPAHDGARSARGGDRALDRRARGPVGVPRRGPGALVRVAAAGGARGVLAREPRAARAAASSAVVSAVGADAAGARSTGRAVAAAPRGGARLVAGAGHRARRAPRGAR